MIVFFFKQKTAYEMRISDWSSDVCSSDLDVQAVQILGSDGLIGADVQNVDPVVRVPERLDRPRDHAARDHGLPEANFVGDQKLPHRILKNGRASCRERVCQYV